MCRRAQLQLAEAEAAVQAAAPTRALWTTAQRRCAMRKPRLRGATTQAARRAAASAHEQAQLGIAQTSYPPFR